MSETLLEALMQLFALLTNYQNEKNNGNAKNHIKDYLERQYNSELAQKYLNIYYDYLNAYHGVSFLPSSQTDDIDQNSNHEQILKICYKLNLEMELEPKILLFIQLIEFVKQNESIGHDEVKMLNVLSAQLKIDNYDFKNLETFVLKNPYNIPDLKALIVISGNKDNNNKPYKHIYNEKQLVTVWILRIKSTNTFIFKYTGERNLYLNGYAIQQNKVYVFAAGSVIKTSIMPPVYYGRIYEMFLERKDKTRIIYKAVDVEHKFNPSLIGVHKFSLIGRSGQLIGIIGGSGTGKSTLLNVLNGNLKLSNGKITINGYNLKTEKEHLKGVIGYVPQDDLLIEELTVYENLYYNAKLCFSKLTNDEIEKIVNKALDDFDLAEAKNLRVGSVLNKTLSGGQRKRLNISLELIRQPGILFADEPTSGLSSMDSEKVMTLLKRQTLIGRLVIINIHQPSSDIYKMFDKLLIIDKGGRVVHNGNPMDAIVYFKTMANYVNPEERECQTCGNVKTEQPLRIIESRKVTPYGKLIRERKITPQAWYKYYLTNFEEKFSWKKTIDNEKKEDLPKNSFSIPKRLQQFKIYFLRDALSKLKDKQYLLINLFEAPLLALILGFFTKYFIKTTHGVNYVFSENMNLPPYLFMCVVVALFLGLNVSAEEIIKDRKLLKRESFLNLSRSSYIFSKVTILFIISAIQTISFVLIGNGMLEITGLNFSYWLILFSMACFANILGLNISSGLNSVVSIYISIPLILVPQMLLSGVIVEFDKLHESILNDENVPIIGDIMISRWGFEALAVNQFVNNEYEKNFFDIEQQMSQVSYYANLLLPELKLQNNEALFALSQNDTNTAINKLLVLKNGLLYNKNLINKNSIDIDKIKHGSFDKNIHYLINQHFDSSIFLYQNRYNLLSKQKDSVYNQLISKFGSPENLLFFKQKHFNKTLSNWVLAKNEIKQIYFNGEKFIQKKHPIYKAPVNKFGRAHFYAPYKNIGKYKIPTLWFNIGVIWLNTFVLLFTLYYDWLRKTIVYFERFKLRKLYRRQQKMWT